MLARPTMSTPLRHERRFPCFWEPAERALTYDGEMFTWRRFLNVGLLVALPLVGACPREAAPARTDVPESASLSSTTAAATVATPPAPPSDPSTTHPTSTRRRIRTGPPVKLPGKAPGLPNGSITFNPKAPPPANGSILVAPDDRCYYETIQGAPSNSPVDPWRKIYVDCPREFDDPAFDSCIGGRLQGVRTAPPCLCTGEGGSGWGVACPK